MANTQYGLEFGPKLSDLEIELLCLRYRHSEKAGGLGHEGHLKNVMISLRPQLYEGEIEPGIPRWRDEIDLMVKLWCRYNIVSVLGHASAAKTHTFAHVVAAEYFADPENTIVTLTSTHLPGLKKRLWADTVSALKTNSVGAPFHIKTHDLTARPTQFRDEVKYVIEGIATDKSSEAAEKIQGNHSRNKRFVVIDEAAGTSHAIYDAAANLMSDHEFRMAMLANPVDWFTEFGTWCEPVDGRESIDSEVDQHWETKRGGVCMRLDGLNSPNIVHNRVVFPFLIDKSYLQKVRNSYGEGSSRWWTFVRGWFPPDGTIGVVFSSAILERGSGRKSFTYRPIPFGALDPAFEGGDACALLFGEYDSSFNFNVVETVTVKVEVKTGDREPIELKIAKKVMELAKGRGVKPENFIVDSTSAGRSVAAFLEQLWTDDEDGDGQIERCSFGGKPTDRLLREGSGEKCTELYDRYVTELWFAAREFTLSGRVGNLDHQKFSILRQQLAARRYETVSEKKEKIETKVVMKDRVGYSPDEADAFCMGVELLRRKGAKPAGNSDPIVNRRKKGMETARKLSAIDNEDTMFSVHII